MSEPVQDLVQAAGRLGAAGAAELAEDLPEEVLQGAVTQLLKAYLIRRESGGEFLPVTAQITATEASVAASAIMQAADLEFFELTLWNSWGRV